MPGRYDYDESKIGVRPGRRGTRPRTKDRPAHKNAVIGMVTGVDRGRWTVLVDDLDPAVVALMGWDRQGCRVAGLTSLLGFELDEAGVVGVDVEVPQEPGQNDGGAGVDLVRVQLEQAVTATQPLIGECRDHVSGRPRHVRGSEPRQAWGEPRNGLSGQPRQLEDHLSGQSARCGLSPRVTRLSGGLARRSRVHSSAACGRALTVKVTKLKVSYSKSCPYGGRWTKS